MKALYPLLAVTALILIALVGVWLAGLRLVFGVIIPYAAIATFVVGFVYRVIKWARSPVPFRITTTAGQQKSLPWIKANNLESPYNTAGVIGRMALEILFFRSLFRNTKTRMEGQKIVYGEEKFLWAAGLAFHWSLLVVLLRHYRFFVEPVPAFVTWIQSVDGFVSIGVPTLYISTAVILGALTFLFLRRVVLSQIRYISLPADYFALFLILGIAGTGAFMRHVYRVDIVGVKEIAMGLVSFHPVAPESVSAMFYIHLFLVSTLVAYFPFSKLMHLGGIFLSPTRNLANTNRMRRHINPWNYPVNVHTYAEWEEEFKDKLVAAGYPLDSEEEEKKREDILV
jgi:nitrate reductase gamma subunit